MNEKKDVVGALLFKALVENRPKELPASEPKSCNI